MYRSNHLTGFGGADTVKFEVTHVGDTGLTTVTAANPITASSVNLGSFGGTKHVILGVYCNAEPGPITGVTVAGETGTIIIEEGSGTAKQTQNALVICGLTGVTSGDIVITVQSGGYNPSKYAISVYQMTKGNATPTDTWGPDFGTTPTGTINIAAGGFCISQASALTSSTFTWSGLTERFDSASNPSVSVAADFDMSAETGRSITATPSGSPSQRVGIGASFEAA